MTYQFQEFPQSNSNRVSKQFLFISIFTNNPNLKQGKEEYPKIRFGFIILESLVPQILYQRLQLL